MPAEPIYRYQFDESVPAEELETTLVLAILAVEAIHGEAQTRMDAAHAFDGKRRAVVIAGGTDVGTDFNKLFLGFVSREFGPRSFRVERVPQKLRPEPLTA